MTKKSKITIEEIRKNLLVESYEDVYEKYFAGKSFSDELFKIFLDSFDLMDLDLNLSDFEEDNFINFSLWVHEQCEHIVNGKFPKFINYYIQSIYRDNGLYNFEKMGKRNFLVFKNRPDDYGGIDYLIRDYETKLVNKSWWSDYEETIWEELQRKRSIVAEFEIYIYSLENEIFETWAEDNEVLFEKYTSICLKHIERIKMEIASIKLFQDGIERIPVLENLLDYIAALSKDVSYYYYNPKESEEKNLVRVQQTLKLNLLHQFGIIKFLKRVWVENQIDKPLEFLLATLIDEKQSSIQPRLSSKDDPKLRTKPANKKLEKYLEDFDLEQDHIKNPK